MTRVAMITLLVVICTALIVEAKSVHRRKRNRESQRLKRKMPHGWEKKFDKKVNGFIYINHLTGAVDRTPPPPDTGNKPIPTSAPITKHEQGQCKEGWRFSFNYCYYISDYADVKTQSEASAACKEKGADLFWQNFHFESFWLKTEINEKVVLSTYYLWTTGQKQNDKWSWGTDKPAFEGVKWLTGQPDGEGKCITIYTANGFMDDKSCETKFNYVCKTKL
ncbi:C-type lectin domain family 6 member A-like isoform X1 [Mytilus californianus]|uniref:C-type lectin domain family 6 member A-like isoform X1 n=1 Tax=Mytilus californianus TaxID=6549 RepID=UPI0022487132|nr:C-type lectin domain family 6 member A-like isoform X1 [Mytilus californianus]XP_052072781.1 C-type lectin domain family 6 member A-like isoform X1 [Mytilus californianus]